MSRSSLTLSLAWVVSCVPGVAAQSGGIPIGDTIRVERAILLSGMVGAPGVLVDQRGDTIVMRALHREGETTLLLTRDSRVQVQRGSKPFGIWKGALSGGVLGGIAAGVVLAFTKECVPERRTESGIPSPWNSAWTSYPSFGGSSPKEDCTYSTAAAATVFLGATVLGGVLGAIIKQDQWMEVGSGSVGFGFDFTPSAASASLQIRF